MNQIPCKENKCILYPVCRYKEEIECNDLYRWLRFDKSDAHTFYKNKYRWLRMQDCLPYIDSVSHENVTVTSRGVHEFTMHQK